MPKVSVIIPVYGVEQYIERCAKSLFEQTLDDIEFLFIDDCTPDSSILILNRVLQDYPHRIPSVRIIRMEKNSGQAAVRSRGMYLSTGDYIIHCDSDDWIDKTMYEQMYSVAVSKKCDCVICGYTRSDGINTIETIFEKVTDSIFEDLLSHKISYSLCNKMYRKDTFDGTSFIAPKGNMGEDLIINLQLAKNVSRAAVVNESLYFYYKNIGSICLTPTKESAINRFIQSSKNVTVLLDFFKSSNIYDKYKASVISLIARKRVWLVPFLQDDECYALWKNSFSEINRDLLLNIHVPLKEKLRFILNYLKIKI